MSMMVMTDNKFAELKDAAGTVSLLRLRLSAAPRRSAYLLGLEVGEAPRVGSHLLGRVCAENYLSPGYRGSSWWLFTVHALTAWRLARNLLWVPLETQSNLKIRTSTSSWKSASSPGSCSPTQRSQRSRYPLGCQRMPIQRRRSSGRDPRCVNKHTVKFYVSGEHQVAVYLQVLAFKNCRSESLSACVLS